MIVPEITVAKTFLKLTFLSISLLINTMDTMARAVYIIYESNQIIPDFSGKKGLAMVLLITKSDIKIKLKGNK